MPSTPKLYTWHYFTCFGFVLCYAFYFCFFVVVFSFFYSPKIPLPTQFLKKYFCQKRKSRCNTYLHKVFQKKREKENEEERQKKGVYLRPSVGTRGVQNDNSEVRPPSVELLHPLVHHCCWTHNHHRSQANIPKITCITVNTQSPLVPGWHT